MKDEGFLWLEMHLGFFGAYCLGFRVSTHTLAQGWHGVRRSGFRDFGV